MVAEHPAAGLAEYAGIPIAFVVDRVLDVVAVDGGLGGLRLVERRLAAPCEKDYDAPPGEGPAAWAERFDLSRWGLLVARAGGRPVGGAAVALPGSGLAMPGERADLAVLWDIRVAPDARRQGAGGALFRAAAAWARARGCRQLVAETQNTNVPACRFYARQGCTLGGIRRFAYAAFPDEVELLWYRSLPGADPVAAGPAATSPAG